MVGTSVKKSTKEDKERIKEIDGPGRAHDRGYDAARNVQDAEGRQGRHHAVGRPLAIRRAEGEDALARHQPGAPSRLYGLCRHGELVQEIDKALYNPVWEQVRKPAPWESRARTGRRRAMAQIAEEAAALAADPVKARARRAAPRAMCKCKSVDLGAIEDAIRALRPEHVEGVREKTNASGGCGACAAAHRGDPRGEATLSECRQALQSCWRRSERGMAKVVTSKKACAVNPLKMSQPIGGALAFMGLRGCMPLLHGSQGCTSFGLVLFVRHFKEAIPMQTTAMSEVATVLGGYENVEQAVLNIIKRTKPEIIGICLDRRHRDQGRRRRRLYHADPPEPSRARGISDRLLSRRRTSKTPFRTAGPRPSRAWSRNWCRPRSTRRGATNLRSTCCPAAI